MVRSFSSCDIVPHPLGLAFSDERTKWIIRDCHFEAFFHRVVSLVNCSIDVPRGVKIGFWLALRRAHVLLWLINIFAERFVLVAQSLATARRENDPSILILPFLFTRLILL
jgi:hypothetical protein